MLQQLPLLMLALCLALLGSVGATQPITAAATTPPVRIELLSVTPDALDPKATVTVTGKVTNTSGKPLRWVSVVLWRDYYPVVSPADFQYMLNSPADVPMGARMTSPESSFVNLNTEAKPDFEAGATARFTLRAKVSDLGLVNPTPGAAYLLGIHVRGYPVDGDNQTLGRSRFVLPWAPGSEAREAARITPVVQLTSAPSMALDGTLTDDHLAGELKGRLELLMRVAEKPGAAVLVDPALFDELTLMAGGYTHSGGVKVPATDPRARAAAAWLGRLEKLRAGGSLYRTPYGNPDLAVAVAARRGDVVNRSKAAMPAKHPLADLPLAIWLEHGATLPASSRSFLSGLKPHLWVEPAASSGAWQLGSSTLLRFDPRVSTGGPGPDPKSSVPQRRGRLLSQLVVEQRPLVLPVRNTSEAQTVLELPSWVSTIPLERMATQLGVPADSKAVPIPSGILRINAAQTTWHRLRNWNDLTGAEGGNHPDQLASRAMNPLVADRQNTWLKAATASVPQSFGGGVSLSMAGSFVMGDRSTTLPITITNRSSHPVRVKVVMTSDNAARITIPDTRLVTIAPGRSAQVTFRPEATTNGVVGFTAQLHTEGGTPIGQSRRFSVNATNFGRVGWIIIIASGLVLMGGTAIRIRQVQHERGRTAAKPPRATPARRPDITSRPHP